MRAASSPKNSLVLFKIALMKASSRYCGVRSSLLPIASCCLLHRWNQQISQRIPSSVNFSINRAQHPASLTCMSPHQPALFAC